MSEDYELRYAARIERRYRRYKAAGGKDLRPWDIQKLIDQGLADENGLTKAGQLKLHQLDLLKWMQDEEKKKNEQRKD